MSSLQYRFLHPLGLTDTRSCPFSMKLTASGKTSISACRALPQQLTVWPETAVASMAMAEVTMLGRILKVLNAESDKDIWNSLYGRICESSKQVGGCWLMGTL